MIERQFVKQKLKEFQIAEYVGETLKNVGLSSVKMQRTPLGEKIIIGASRPGLVVGREGQNIKSLTKTLKKKFGLENPQIEISEIENPNIDAKIIAEKISSGLERFGTTKFKGIGHKVMTDAMNAGARGIEISISGKVPSSRAKSWRFYSGYLKKCGNVAVEGVQTAYTTAELKSGTIGIQVRIMPPNLKMPDEIKIKEEVEVQKIEPKKEEATEEKEEKKEAVKEEIKETEEKKVKKAKKEKQSEEKPKGKKKKTEEVEEI
jgi:small subunit ribosomal protein S3